MKTLLYAHLCLIHVFFSINSQSQSLIKFSPGEIEPGASVFVGGLPSPGPLKSDYVSHTVPYEGGYNESKTAIAITKVTFNERASATTYFGTIIITSSVGGTCYGLNQGGHGEIKSKYTSDLQVSNPRSGEWRVTIEVNGSVDNGGTLEGQYVCFISGSGGFVKKIMCPFDNTTHSEDFSIPPGVYRFTLYCPKFIQGCYGAQPGTFGYRDFYTSVNVKLYNR